MKTHPPLYPHSKSVRSIQRCFLLCPGFRSVLPVVVWMIAVICGFGFLVNYSTTPGTESPSDVSTTWPEESNLEWNRQKATLVMFVHPKCPCSRASLGELEVILSRCCNRLETHVAFVHPKNVDPEWIKSDLWNLAGKIPGVNVIVDNEGREAKLFGAKTSGWVVLYDRQGKLAFCGGITSSRSHHGDNIGRESVVAQLTHPEDLCRTWLVYGCPLWNENDIPGVTEQ